MARTHARVKGKSGSKKPVNVDLSFVNYDKKQVEELVVKFAKDDYKASMIGMVLRDTYGIGDVKKITGKSIGKILEENDLLGQIPEDLQNLVDKAYKLKKHLSNNNRDTHNKRGLQLIEAKVRRLSKYYKNKKVIPQNWSLW